MQANTIATTANTTKIAPTAAQAVLPKAVVTAELIALRSAFNRADESRRSLILATLAETTGSNADKIAAALAILQPAPRPTQATPAHKPATKVIPQGMAARLLPAVPVCAGLVELRRYAAALPEALQESFIYRATEVYGDLDSDENVDWAGLITEAEWQIAPEREAYERRLAPPAPRTGKTERNRNRNAQKRNERSARDAEQRARMKGTTSGGGKKH